MLIGSVFGLSNRQPNLPFVRFQEAPLSVEKFVHKRSELYSFERSEYRSRGRRVVVSLGVTLVAGRGRQTICSPTNSRSRYINPKIRAIISFFSSKKRKEVTGILDLLFLDRKRTGIAVLSGEKN